MENCRKTVLLKKVERQDTKEDLNSWKQEALKRVTPAKLALEMQLKLLWDIHYNYRELSSLAFANNRKWTRRVWRKGDPHALFGEDIASVPIHNGTFMQLHQVTKYERFIWANETKSTLLTHI